MFIARPLSIQEVNSLLSENFVRIFGNIVEHFPAAAIGILKHRPFKDISSIIQATNDLLDSLNFQDIDDILQLYPDTIEKLITHHCTSFDKEISHDIPCEIKIEEKIKLLDLNKQYKEKFGFSFILCYKKNDILAVFSNLMRRLQNSREQEIQTATKEVKKILSLRIHELVQ